MTGAPEEPIVTTTMFTAAEKAAWEVAVDRGLAIEAADLRALLNAAVADDSAKLARIREAAAEWASRCPPGDWGETGSMAEAVIADAGRDLLRLLGEEGA